MKLSPMSYQRSYSFISLAWPDPIFAQGRYRFQYKRPARKGLVQFTVSTGSDTQHGGAGC